MSETASTISAEERTAILNGVVADYALDGWTISGVLAGQAIAQRRETLGGNNFWLSSLFWLATILLSLATAGLFLIVTAILFLNRGTETRVITVDDRGRVRVR